MSQSALYSESQAALANLSLERLGLSSWNICEVQGLQAKVKAKADGWFGPKSVAKWKAWARKHDSKPATLDHPTDSATPGHAVINGVQYQAPKGLKYVNHLEPNGIPAQIDDTSRRKRPVSLLVLHRGWGGSYKKGRNFAAKTEATLDARGLSGTHSMDIDGTIYQHFDPHARRGRHCTHHNVQSDSLDVAGPFGMKRKPAPGQERTSFLAAIGRKNDGVPPLQRKYGTVKCWDMTDAQKEALKLFIPWWCELRGIPLTACEGWRTFRLSSHSGRRDPVTKVEGIVAHAQVSSPGKRVDGILPLIVLKESNVMIEWRPAEDFIAD
jgi:hypothetical protein